VVRAAVSARPSAAHPFADAERTLHGSESSPPTSTLVVGRRSGWAEESGCAQGAHSKPVATPSRGSRSSLRRKPLPLIARQQIRPFTLRRYAALAPLVPITSDCRFKKQTSTCLGKVTPHEVEVSRHLIIRINQSIADFDWLSLYLVGYFG
jgi:hypothetical protein